MTALLSLFTLARPFLAAAWSALQKPAVLIAVGFAVLIGALWWEAHGRSAALAQAKAAKAALAAEKAAEAFKARQAVVTDRAAAADASAQSRILTVYKTLSMEIPNAIPPSADAQCVVPPAAVRLLDAGVSGVSLPEPSGGADAAAPAGSLSGVAAGYLATLEAKRANDQQLTDLQAWVLAQQAIKP